jgi:hypothetical protein
MSWTFHPPPGWPLPEGWVPPPGWAPDPGWPPAPPDWQFWQPAAAPPGGGPLTTPTLAAPALAEPARPGTGRPWFGRWWAIAGLVALLLVGSAVGFGGTRVALELAADGDQPAATGPTAGPDRDDPGGAVPTPSGAPTAEPGAEPEPTAPASPGSPAFPSVPPPPGGAGGEVCTEVAFIMLTMIAVAADPEQDPTLIVDSWATAADELRSLAGQTADPAEQSALETLADDFDAAVRAAEDDPGDRSALAAEFDRLSESYDAFNTQIC